MSIIFNIGDTVKTKQSYIDKYKRKKNSLNKSFFVYSSRFNITGISNYTIGLATNESVLNKQYKLRQQMEVFSGNNSNNYISCKKLLIERLKDL